MLADYYHKINPKNDEYVHNQLEIPGCTALKGCNGNGRLEIGIIKKKHV